ncbi:TonB-dependent receptor [Muriicola sp. Z0-33]|uniref:TonB-dependent receptor n=1 Tax=Muriicola sp. Z0-33 TaxID=2816957 RepID=UPI00223885CF|nr:TonB-dependent receptor [Muriicola sp. Z0-33]MCW5515874.1 carboxypeptidase-like regulatory domain-containing protein [Muriicola sp. Z0-33]
MKFSKLFLTVFFLCSFLAMRAQTATITGVVLDEDNRPLGNVNISSKANGTFTDNNGFYILKVIADIENTITFSHLGHKNIVIQKLILTTNETYEFNPVMKIEVQQVDGVVVTPTGEKSVDGIVSISPEVVRKMPGANAGVENVLKLLPGVSSNNELSTQYAVRGGNYDENLVYINDIEVYRPFLIRSGQQEGFSFVNSNMVQRLAFSPGGFQARYGDKLSSVLDITYKNPSQFGLQIEGSLLGVNGTVETISRNKNFSGIMGVRYRDNSLFVNSQQTKTNFNPAFADLQSYLTYRFNRKFHLNFLGNISLNNYRNEPLTRQTNFGTLSDPMALLVFYEGQEKNKYATSLGALKADYYVNENTALNFIASLYHTTEEEYSDVIAAYELGAVDTDLGSENLGEAIGTRGIGTQFNRARNDLDALILNIEHKAKYSKNKKSLEWGIKYTHEDIRDQIREAEFIDSVGFLVRPPLDEFVNNQPQDPFNAPIVPFEGINARNFVKTNRFSAYVQFSDQFKWKNHDIYYNLGMRAQRWTVNAEGYQKNTQSIFSPRGQIALKPNWDKDMLFRFAVGSYQQPPFYRELRDINGNIRPEVKAQKSVHFVLGNEYSLTLWNRPFTFFSQAYYKKLNNVNAYTLEDVRIRYAADNDAKAYAYGIDLRMNGAFVPGTTSWVSIGYLKTEENINERGYISRPTDQRLKVGILFQDYIPTIPNLRMYLNLVYNTGVPGGSPNYADPYIFQNRLRDYRRADLGISYIFVDTNKKYPKNHWLYQFEELNVGFEIFNLFNNQNSITNTWVRDVESKQQFAVPNFMTTRVLNLKLRMRF